MGLPHSWVTDPAHGLSANQANTALGNGVLPSTCRYQVTSTNRRFVLSQTINTQRLTKRRIAR